MDTYTVKFYCVNRAGAHFHIGTANNIRARTFDDAAKEGILALSEAGFCDNGFAGVTDCVNGKHKDKWLHIGWDVLVMRLFCGDREVMSKPVCFP